MKPFAILEFLLSSFYFERSPKNYLAISISRLSYSYLPVQLYSSSTAELVTELVVKGKEVEAQDFDVLILIVLGLGPFFAGF